MKSIALHCQMSHIPITTLQHYYLHLRSLLNTLALNCEIFAQMNYPKPIENLEHSIPLCHLKAFVWMRANIQLL